jgi:hypothetical protein
VSGEVVILQGGTNGNVESLVRAAGIVVAHAGVRTAVIGGLAVTCRLATAHRATADVDFVADDPAASDRPTILAATASAADNVVAAGVAEREEGVATVRLRIDGTKVEIIETSPVAPEDSALIEPELARLFVLAHRWALESATTCRIGVVGSPVEVEVPVATSAALVAMKLHALQDRSDDRKRASDAWDLFRLMDAHSQRPEFAPCFAAAPDGLTQLVQQAVARCLRDDATRTRRWMVAYGDPAWAAQATEQALIDVADEFARVVP